MKKKIMAVLLAASVTLNGVLLTASPVMAAITSLFTYKKTQVAVVKTKSDMAEFQKMVAKRKGKILVEVIEGTVTDNKGNGKQSNGYYIGYNPKKFKKGDKVMTVSIYNPANNYEDDILYRVDTLIE